VAGTIIDKLGGYQGAVATARTLRVCAFFAVLAASSAALCAFVPKVAGSDDPDLGFWLTISLIALTLLFGGAIIPAATAIIVSAVDPDLRQLASAGSIFMFQQLGTRPRHAQSHAPKPRHTRHRHTHATRATRATSHTSRTSCPTPPDPPDPLPSHHPPYHV
jgi:hypothetical protein